VQASASQPKFSLERRKMCCDTTARQAFHLVFGGFLFRCDENAARAEQRRGHLGPRIAPGDAGDEGDEVCQGSGDRGVD